MEINHPVGIVAVVLGVISFHGSIYVVVALNTGWRFGYWITGAAMGGLMLFLSAFWVVTALGPRGEEPHWIPIAADAQSIGNAQLDETTFSSPGAYPGGGWQPTEQAGIATTEEEALTSSLSNCLTADVESLSAEEAETCETAQGFLPAEADLPTIEGQTVVMQQDFRDVAFIEEAGTQLGQVTVVPVTRDPRVADDPEEGEPVGEPFRLLAYRDPGSLRLPAIGSLVISGFWLAFHMWGLNRSERRQLSPVAS